MSTEGLVAAETRADATPRAERRTRGRRQHQLFEIRGSLTTGWRVALGVVGVAAVFVLWIVASASLEGGSFLLPSPSATWDAFTEMLREGTLRTDLLASVRRVAIGYGISIVLGVLFGVAIGTFVSAEALFEPQIGFLRYIPASALTPVFLIWLGIDETPKIWLIVVGTVFYNILMVADVARGVPRELLNASATLGSGRWRTLSRVVLPHSWPGIIDVARINLAAAWLMLVVAELLAAEEGLAFRIIRAQRFRAVDRMFALLVVFGVIGLVSDLALRRLRWLVGRWARP